MRSTTISIVFTLRTHFVVSVKHAHEVFTPLRLQLLRPGLTRSAPQQCPHAPRLPRRAGEVDYGCTQVTKCVVPPSILIIATGLIGSRSGPIVIVPDTPA